MTELAVLNHAEQVALEECERVIGEGIKTFVAVGSSLSFVRDNRLYRGTHETFEAYARERWNLSRPRAYELMEAAEVVSGMPDTETPVTNARQAVELAKVPEPERAEVWRETVERTNGKPTAEAVKAVRKERAEPKPEPKPEPVMPPRSTPDTTDPVANVAAALDKYVPDPDAPARAWRGQFHGLLKAPHDFLVRCDADQIAQYAEDQDVETLRLLADSYSILYRRVLAKRGGNITPLRRVK